MGPGARRSKRLPAASCAAFIASANSSTSTSTLGDTAGPVPAASFGLFLLFNGRPRFFTEGDSSAAASPSMTLASWASVNMRISAARVSWGSIWYCSRKDLDRQHRVGGQLFRGFRGLVRQANGNVARPLFLLLGPSFRRIFRLSTSELEIVVFSRLFFSRRRELENAIGNGAADIALLLTSFSQTSG